MTSQAFRLKLTRVNQLKLKVNARIPAVITAQSPIVLDKTNGTYALSFDADAISGNFATAAQGALADSAIQSVVAGSNVTVDNTDPRNPVVSASGGGGGGSGDVTGPSSSVDGEIALFDSTTGKVIKRASTTGILKGASGVLSAAVAGTDYYNPGGTDVAVVDGGTGASSASGARANLGSTTVGDAVFIAANAAAARTAIGAGTISTQNSNSVSITGGSITGITDLAIADGGTGQSTASAAFDALAPTTTRGDIVFRNASTNTRLAASTAGYHLQTNGAASDPTYVGYQRSATGSSARTWQAKADDAISPLDFGAVGDGTTDDSTALAALFTYIGTLPHPNNNSHYRVDGGGRTYATSLPLSLPSFLSLENASFKALSGGSWSGGGTSGSGSAIVITTGTNGVLTLSNVGFVRLQNIGVSANRIANVQCIYASGANYSNVWDTVTCKNWTTGGNGIVLGTGSGLTNGTNIDSLQWVNGDAEYGVVANFKGVALAMVGAVDGTITEGNFGNTLVPIYFDTASHSMRLVNTHTYSVTSSPLADPYGIIYDGYDCHIRNHYLDIAPLLIRTSASTTNGRPTITLTGTNALYNSSYTTFSSWIQFTTSLASTPLYGVILKDNSLPGASPFSFATTGSGSWSISSAALARLNAATGDSSLMEPTGTATEFMTNIDMLSYGVLTGHLNKVVTDTGTTRNLSADDTGTLLLMTNSGSVALTALANVTRAMTVDIFLPNQTGTIVAGAGGTINGSASSITLFQNKLYKLEWIFGSGSNAQYALSEQARAATAAPLLAGTAAVGTSGDFARADHVHPTNASRNRIVNPSGQINQAGSSTAADGTYWFDQWIHLNQSNPVTPSQVTNAENGTPYMIRTTQSNASAQRFGIIQPIESVNCIDLRGQSVTLSARVRCSASTTLRYAIVEWTGTADSPTKDIVNDWTSGTFTTGNFFISTTTTVVATGSTALTSNTLATVSLTGTVSGSMNNLHVFFWTDSTQAQNVTLDIGKVQLEVGTTASPFVVRSYSEELALCLRYLWHQAPNASFAPFAAGMNISTTQALGYLRYPVPMRVAPSVSTANVVNIQVLQGGSGFTLSGFALDAPDTYGTNLLVTTSGLTAGAACIIRTVNAFGDMVLNARM